MNIPETTKNSLQIVNNPNLIVDLTYRKLLENCFSILSGDAEVHSLAGLYNSKPDVIKQLYAAFLSVTAHFVRNNQNLEDVTNYLANECGFGPAKISTYTEFYEKHQKDIEVSLLNIGNHLPHITDVNWKIDYVVKMNSVDECEGPLFRISLITEKFDCETDGKKVEHITFTCNSQELQDLVYKLKDAVRHCQKIVQDH